jgi:RimJ/RimL family protein N-acetyltransferase
LDGCFILSSKFYHFPGFKVCSAPTTNECATSILEHLQIAHQESYLFLNQDHQAFVNMTVEDELKILKEFQDSPSKLMLIAVENENQRVVGCLGFVGATAPFIKHQGQFGMSVQKSYQGRGVGKALLQTLLDILPQNGFTKVSLTVRTENVKAIKLYDKMGFRRVGIHERAALIEGQYLDEYSYEKVL